MFTSREISAFLWGLSVTLIPWGATEMGAIDLNAGAAILTIGLICAAFAIALQFYPYRTRGIRSSKFPFLTFLAPVHFGDPEIQVAARNRVVCIPVTLTTDAASLDRCSVGLLFDGNVQHDSGEARNYLPSDPGFIHLRWIDRNHETGSIDKVTLEYGQEHYAILLAANNELPQYIANETFLKRGRKKWRVSNMNEAHFVVRVSSGARSYDSRKYTLELPNID